MQKDENEENSIIAQDFVILLERKGPSYSKIILIALIAKEQAEKRLLARITSILSKYNWLIGFDSTGVRLYNPSRHKITGRDSD